MDLKLYLFLVLFFNLILSSNAQIKTNSATDSLQQKANHNTARSNKSTIKGDGSANKDSVVIKANINTSRSNIKRGKAADNNSGDTNSATDSLQQKANINTSRSNSKGIISNNEIENFTSKSQPNKYGGGYVTLIRISGGVGTLIPISSLKDEAYVTPSTSVGLNALIPFLQNSKMDFGLTIGGDYFFSTKNQISRNPSAFSVIEQTLNEVMYNPLSNGSKQVGYKLEIGPQLSFKIRNNIDISTMFHVGYLNITQNAFEIKQHNTSLVKDAFYTLLKQDKLNNTGLAMTPKFRITYLLNSFGFWVESNYLFGPSVTNTTAVFLPNGSVNQNNQYTVRQMDEGSFKQITHKNNFNNLGLQAGLAYIFSKKRI